MHSLCEESNSVCILLFTENRSLEFLIYWQSEFGIAIVDKGRSYWIKSDYMTFLSIFYIYRKLRRKVRYGMSQSHHPLTQTIYIHHEYSHSHFCDNHLILLSVVYSELSITQKVLVSLLIFLSYKSEFLKIISYFH